MGGRGGALNAKVNHMQPKWGKGGGGSETYEVWNEGKEVPGTCIFKLQEALFLAIGLLIQCAALLQPLDGRVFALCLVPRCSSLILSLSSLLLSVVDASC